MFKWRTFLDLFWIVYWSSPKKFWKVAIWKSSSNIYYIWLLVVWRTEKMSTKPVTLMKTRENNGTLYHRISKELNTLDSLLLQHYYKYQVINGKSYTIWKTPIKLSNTVSLVHPLQCSHCWRNCCQQHSLHNHHPNLTLWLSSSPWYHKPFVFHRSIRTEHHPNSIWCRIRSIKWSVISTVPAKQWPLSTELLLHISVFPKLFWLAPPFLTTNFYRSPTTHTMPSTRQHNFFVFYNWDVWKWL